MCSPEAHVSIPVSGVRSSSAGIYQTPGELFAGFERSIKASYLYFNVNINADFIWQRLIVTFFIPIDMRKVIIKLYY